MVLPIFRQLSLFLMFIVPLGHVWGDCCCSQLPSRYGSNPISPPGMVWIPGGEFTMGSDNKDSKKDEKPPHRV